MTEIYGKIWTESERVWIGKLNNNENQKYEKRNQEQYGGNGSHAVD